MPVERRAPFIESALQYTDDSCGPFPDKSEAEIRSGLRKSIESEIKRIRVMQEFGPFGTTVRCPECKRIRNGSRWSHGEIKPGWKETFTVCDRCKSQGKGV